MSYKLPVNPTLTLKGIDKKIQEIKIKMTSLSWLTNSFGMSDRIVEENDYTYPACFESNSVDPVSMMPSDTWTAFSFWIKTGESTFDLNTQFPVKNPIINYPVSCIFYMNIKLIDNTLTYKETKSKIVEDIFHFFNNIQFAGRIVPVRFIEDDITRIYEGYSIDQVDNKWKIYPKYCCRMDFLVSFRDDCYVTNTYTP